MKRESTYMVVREGLIRGLENGKELEREKMGFFHCKTMKIV